MDVYVPAEELDDARYVMLADEVDAVFDDDGDGETAPPHRPSRPALDRRPRHRRPGPRPPGPRGDLGDLTARVTCVRSRREAEPAS